MEIDEPRQAALHLRGQFLSVFPGGGMSSGMPRSPAPQKPSPAARGELPGSWFSPEALAARHRHGPFSSDTAFKPASIPQEPPLASVPVLTPSPTPSLHPLLFPGLTDGKSTQGALSTSPISLHGEAACDCRGETYFCSHFALGARPRCLP